MPAHSDVQRDTDAKYKLDPTFGRRICHKKFARYFEADVKTSGIDEFSLIFRWVVHLPPHYDASTRVAGAGVCFKKAGKHIDEVTHTYAGGRDELGRDFQLHCPHSIRKYFGKNWKELLRNLG